MTTTHHIDKPPITVSRHLPATARDLLTTAAATPNRDTRTQIIGQATDTVRKTWPEYFRTDV
jgi:hypothetical protein